VGYLFAFSPCIRCGVPFGYNPARVPSVIVHGSREPICQDCIAYINAERVKNGREAINVLAGAYDACDESEL